MTNKVILYPNETNGVCICSPSVESGLSIEQVAQKDVPEGKPYIIIETNLMPEQFIFYDALEADFSKPDGYGLGHEKWFKYYEIKKLKGTMT